MAEGICVKLGVEVATACPVAELSTAERGANGESPAVRDVTWAQATGGTVTEEFRVDAAAVDGDPDAVAGAEPVMEVALTAFTSSPATPTPPAPVTSSSGWTARLPTYTRPTALLCSRCLSPTSIGSGRSSPRSTPSPTGCRSDTSFGRTPTPTDGTRWSSTAGR
jgi:hypothetical protein